MIPEIIEFARDYVANAMKEGTHELITATVHRNLDHNTTARRERHAQRLAEASLEPQEHLRTSAEKIRGTDEIDDEYIRGSGLVATLALTSLPSQWPSGGVTVHCLTQYDYYDLHTGWRQATLRTPSTVPHLLRRFVCVDDSLVHFLIPPALPPCPLLKNS